MFEGWPNYKVQRLLYSGEHLRDKYVVSVNIHYIDNGGPGLARDALQAPRTQSLDATEAYWYHIGGGALNT